MVIDFGFPPVSSGEYYIISYNTEDSERVRPIVQQLHREGVPLWYDYGLEYGEHWEGQIAEYIRNSKALIMFITCGIFKKQESYVFKEFSIAKFFEIPIIPVCLDVIDQRLVTSDNVSWWLDIRRIHCIEFPQGTDTQRIATEIKVAIRYSCPDSARQSIEARAAAGHPEPVTARPVAAAPNITTQQKASVPQKASVKPKAGDCIKLGSYPQSTFAPEPIEWIVLACNESQAMLISKYSLTAMCYNLEHATVTWERSYLRWWLNSEFIKQAFSDQEYERIMQVSLNNPDNEQFGTSGGSAIVDRVFCLSTDEVKTYMPSDRQRRCHPTAYAVQNGAVKSDAARYGATWWLRSPGFYGANAAAVMFDGELRSHGIGVTNGSIAVRPAIIIRL